MSVVLGLKLVLVPSLIAGATLAGRQWGAFVAGWLSALPLVAGPILFFIAIEQSIVRGECRSRYSFRSACKPCLRHQLRLVSNALFVDCQPCFRLRGLKCRGRVPHPL